MSFTTNHENPELFASLKAGTKAKMTRLANHLEKLIEDRKGAEAAESQVKETIRPVARQAYFEANEDTRLNQAANHTFDFNNLQVNFVNAYIIRDQAHADQILDLIGDNHPLAEHVQVNTKVSTDISDLVQNDPKRYKAYADALSALNRQYGLQSFVDEKYSVSAQFHDARHALLTAEDNLELDKILPVQVQFTVVD